MRESVTYSVRDEIAVLMIDNPSVNALSRDVRLGLLEAVARLQSDPDAKAAILIGAGATFPAGADLREFEAKAQEPHLPDVCNAIENSAKPIVACLHGTALGGGYEIALAAHARLAIEGTRVGLPEISLGILPGAGATQRLPRLVSIGAALKMLLTGAAVDVEANAQEAFVDGIVEGDLMSAGVAYAKSLANDPPQRTRDLRAHLEDPMAFQEAILDARDAVHNHPTKAANAILDCVEAALLLPFDAGLSRERDHFLELKDSDEARSLRHAFLSTRAATKPRRGLPDPLSIDAVGILGGGLMGAGIAICCLDAGLAVTIVEQSDDTAATSQARIDRVYKRAEQRGVLSEQDRLQRLSRLTTSARISDVGQADLIIEAVREDKDLKTDLLSNLGDVAKPDALIATNTSYLDVDELALASGRPERFLGLHFFSPAHVQMLVEVGIGAETSQVAEATGFAFARTLRKKPVRVGASEGLIGNRILTAYREAADRLLLSGASPYDIDEAMRDYGFKMGPYQVLDLTGFEVSFSRREIAAAAGHPPATRVLEKLVQAGRQGQKNGAGFYTYAKGAKLAERDDFTLQVVEQERVERGVTPRFVPNQEIQRDCLLSMMNEGARLLDEGVAERSGDIDVVMLLGYGFPPHKGGPMKAAELSGLLQHLRQLEAMAEDDAFWEPADALKEAVKNGNRFFGVL